MLAQQFELSEFWRKFCGDTMGERAPMLKVSAANNNRAGSFIGFSLSPARTFQRKFSICG
jgi:hypothetical protein